MSLWGQKATAGRGRGCGRPSDPTLAAGSIKCGPTRRQPKPSEPRSVPPQILQLPAFRTSVAIRMWLPRMLPGRSPGRATRHEIFCWIFFFCRLPRSILGWLGWLQNGPAGQWTREKPLVPVGCLCSALPSAACSVQCAACSFLRSAGPIGLQICLCPASNVSLASWAGSAGWQLEESAGMPAAAPAMLHTAAAGACCCWAESARHLTCRLTRRGTADVLVFGVF